MDDFVGQTENQARTTLSALNVRIKTTKKIDPAAPGTVIEQDPIAGAPFAQDVTLTVAIAPPTVPDVTGETFGTAQQTLINAGFTVKEVPVFDSTLADGLVKAQDPAAGASNASEVTLSVIRRPVVEYLSDMETVGGSAYLDTGAQKANGVTYSHGVKFELSSGGDPSTLEYDLSRQYRQLQGALALDDKSSSEAGVRVEVFGDGRSLFDQTVTFGSTVPLDVDVTDVLRLKITASKVAGKQASMVLGDLKAQGLQSEVESTGTSGAPITSTTATTTR